MNPDPDLTHLFTVTLGLCEKHDLTAFACVKCAGETDLALVAEVQRLREDVRLLRSENKSLRAEIARANGGAS